MKKRMYIALSLILLINASVVPAQMATTSTQQAIQVFNKPTANRKMPENLEVMRARVYQDSLNLSDEEFVAAIEAAYSRPYAEEYLNLKNHRNSLQITLNKLIEESIKNQLNIKDTVKYINDANVRLDILKDKDLKGLLKQKPATAAVSKKAIPNDWAFGTIIKPNLTVFAKEKEKTALEKEQTREFAFNKPEEATIIPGPKSTYGLTVTPDSVSTPTKLPQQTSTSSILTTSPVMTSTLVTTSTSMK